MPAVRAKDLRTIRRGCSNREVRAILVHAVKSGTRYRMSKNGVMLYGETGRAVSVHFTVSDHRAARNLRFELQSQGIETEKK